MMFMLSNSNMTGVEQELLTFPRVSKFTPVFSGVHVAQSLVFCVVFCRLLFVLFVLFLLVFLLSVFLQFMVSNNPLGIFKLFSDKYCQLYILVQAFIQVYLVDYQSKLT